MNKAEELLIRLVDLSDEKEINGKYPTPKDWDGAWDDAKIFVEGLRSKSV